MKEIELQEDRLVNRILINFGIGILAYIVLWLLWKQNLAVIPVFITAGLFLVLAILFFVLAKVKKLAVKNYGYMFSAFTLAALCLKSSLIVSKIIGMQNFMNIMQQKFFQVLLNAQKNVMMVAVLGGIYLVGMLIYNCVKLYKLKQLQ